MVDRTSVKYEKIRRMINENFNNYDMFGSISAKNKIRRLLNENSEIRKEYSWLEEEIGNLN